MKITFMWPPELIITESMFRHYTGIAEIVGYLRDNSPVIRKIDIQINVVDCAVEVKTALNIASIARESILVPVYVNMNNIPEALQLIRFLKSVNPDLCVVVYGEAPSCNPKVFADLPEISFVIGNGQTDYALDLVLCELFHLDPFETINLSENEYNINNKCVMVSKLLPSDNWGMPALDLLPLEQYLALSKGELHLLVNKGCPFHCEFCNERLVSSNVLRYRNVNQVADFLCAEYPDSVRSVYLDASTFTYDRDWVFSLCNAICQYNKHLPWKTCTRLDCIDDELIRAMAKGGCSRISIGVETMDEEIQKRNRKTIDKERMRSFASLCKENGIQPRALLIIGLDGQCFDDIEKAKAFCDECGIDGRFRVLQDYSALISCRDLQHLDTTKLDRWNTWNPFCDLEISKLRKIEYPSQKGASQNYV